ncbi:hypothetical protein CVT25_014321 [Psilocybe cyanescens]|uniref:RING-type domain-containing protein n=1 Tax=Psilocybe cyanescens TaxID=93625 RepID=A0A409XKY2_PSICY|nr:hypothetical protein CVT25_014321 [Psilocybe cyanescens]
MWRGDSGKAQRDVSAGYKNSPTRFVVSRTDEQCREQDIARIEIDLGAFNIEIFIKPTVSYAFTSLLKTDRTVDVNVFVNVAGEEEQKVRLRDVSVPIQYDNLVHRLKQLGYHNHDPNVFFATDAYGVEVTSGKSSFDFTNGGQVNLPAAYPDTKNWSSDALLLIRRSYKTKRLKLEGSLGLDSKDNTKATLFLLTWGHSNYISLLVHSSNTSSLVDNLPQSVVSKGGVCIVSICFFLNSHFSLTVPQSMYQSEVLWISFCLIKPCVLKISVGGVNALTGAPSDVSIPRKIIPHCAMIDPANCKQFVDSSPKLAPRTTKPFIDGWMASWSRFVLLDPSHNLCSNLTGFVSIPLELGKVAEGQIIGHETGGDIQFVVFPLYPTDVCFRHGDTELDIFKTPRQLGLSADDYISMENTGIPTTILSPTHTTFKPLATSITLPLKVDLEPAAPFGCSVTGLPTPPTPVNERIYEKNRYPWLEIYDERILVVDLNSVLREAATTPLRLPPPLVECTASTPRKTSSCACCLLKKASVALRPCSHTVCKGCSCVVTCPSCEERVVDRIEEVQDMMDDFRLLEKRVERLRPNAGTKNVTPFKLNC